MAYSRREVIDYETVMNADLYNNLQDGIDEGKEALGDINIAEKGTVQVQLDKISKNVSNVRLVYNRDTQYMEYGTPKEPEDNTGEGGNDDMGEEDVITPEEAAEIFNSAEAAANSEDA